MQVYNTTNLDNRVNPLLLKRDFNSIQSNQIFHPTIGFRWSSNGKWKHEVEISQLFHNKSEPSSKNLITSKPTQDYGIQKDHHYAFRYEASYSLFEKKKIQTFIGGGVLPYFQRNSFNPLARNSFPKSWNEIGAIFHITPRITYYLHPRIFMDVNIPINILNLAYTSSFIRNPAIPVKEQMQSDVHSHFMPNLFTGRVGLGFVF